MNKYKAKRLDDNEWVEGFYAIKGEGTDLEQHVICLSALDNCSSIDRFYLVDTEVDPKTISQATGLKDKNGKMLFDGDIRKVFMPHWEKIEQIGYYGFRWVTYHKNRFDDLCLGDDLTGSSDFEIIGNIHDK